MDLLAGGRINPGLSVGEPMHYDTVKHELYPDSSELEESGYARVNRLARLIAGERVRDFSGRQGVVEEFSNRVEPHSPGLRDRLWYGWRSHSPLALTTRTMSRSLPTSPAGWAPPWDGLRRRLAKTHRTAHDLIRPSTHPGKCTPGRFGHSLARWGQIP